MKLNVSEILTNAGADPNAPEGSQAWALAQVDAAVAEIMGAMTRIQIRAQYHEGDTPEDRARDLRIIYGIASSVLRYGVNAPVRVCVRQHSKGGA